MEHAYGVAGLGAAAFWLFIAAVSVAGIWDKSRRNSEKHETLRRIVEKTGNVDEAKLREVFNSSSGFDRPLPGEVYRGLRIGGAIVLCVSVGLEGFFFVLGRTGAISQTASTISMAAGGR